MIRRIKLEREGGVKFKVSNQSEPYLHMTNEFASYGWKEMICTREHNEGVVHTAKYKLENIQFQWKFLKSTKSPMRTFLFR